MRSVTVRALAEDYEKAASFLRTELRRSKLSSQIISENIMVFEALFNDIIRKGPPKDEIKIEIRRSFGNPVVKFGFVGKRYVPDGGNSIEDAVEYKIIKAYEDKLDFSYHASYNIIKLNVKRAYLPQVLLSGASILAAVLVFAAISNIKSLDKSALLTTCIKPTEGLFANAMLLIGTPLTFFSALKNLLETRIIAERNSHARRLQFKTMETSVAAVALALLFGLGMKRFEPFFSGAFGSVVFTGFSGKDLPVLISSLLPTDLFEAFKTLSPFPLILISLLIVVALRSAGGQFDRLKRGIDACYVLFSRMLNFVMFFLPVFCFLAFLDILLDGGAARFKGVFLCFGMTFLGLAVLFVLYAVRLKLAGIPVIGFIRTLLPVFRENLRINSAIDAVPYNIRQCSKLFGINRRYLEDALPVLAQTNLDGNCFIIMEITLLLIVSAGASLPFWNYLLLAAVIVFLSLGAPNQPGSILIGVLIIVNYLQAPELMPVAIYCEVLLGAGQNFANVVGDLVMTTIEYRKLEGKPEASRS